MVVLLTYFTYFSMAIRGTPAFSDISTYTGGLPFRIMSAPFFAKVSTLQTQGGNTRIPMGRIPTMRTRDQTQYQRRMIYRLAWSIVCFTTTTAAQENRPAYIGSYAVPGMGHLTFPDCTTLSGPQSEWCSCGLTSLTHNVASIAPPT